MSEIESNPTETETQPEAPARLTVDETWAEIRAILKVNGYQMHPFAIGNTTGEPSNLADFTGHAHTAQILIFEQRK